MNILVDLYRCFCLVVLAASLKNKENRVRTDPKRPLVLQRRGNFPTDRQQSWLGLEENKEEKYIQPIRRYATTGMPFAYSINRRSQQEQTTNQTDTDHLNASATGPSNAFNPVLMPFGSDQNDPKFQELLCLSDCKMKDLPIFNFQFPFRNITFPSQSKLLPNRPYSFATLADWCNEHCGAKAENNGPPNLTPVSTASPDDLHHESPDDHMHSPPEIRYSPQLDQSPQIMSPIQTLPYMHYPPGRYQPLPPVIPQMFVPPVQNLFPFGNLMTTSLLYHLYDGRRVVNTQQSPQSYHSVRRNNAKTYPNQVHQNAHMPGIQNPTRPIPEIFMDTRRTIGNHAEQLQLKVSRNNFAGENSNFHDKIVSENDPEEEQTDNDAYDEVSVDGYEENDSIEPIVLFLQKIARLLSNKTVLNFLKRAAGCDERSLAFTPHPKHVDLTSSEPPLNISRI